MNNFEINTNGLLSIKAKTRDFYEMIFGGVVFYVVLLCASKYTIDSRGYFVFLSIFLTMLYIFIFIIVPISLMIRINKVVRKIKVEEDKIWLVSNKEYSFNKVDLTLKVVKNKFTGFSKTNKDGILISTRTGKEYWIIADFLNDFDTLKKQLEINLE